MRPVSIVRFERLYLGVVLAGLIIDILILFKQSAKLAVVTKVGLTGLQVSILSALVGLAISLLLWFLVARRGYVIAKWIVVIRFALLAIGMAYTLYRFGFRIGPLTSLSLVVLLVHGWAISYLFKPDAIEWLGKKQTA